MTIIVGMYRGGIIVAEASAESAALVGQTIREGIEGGANAFSTGSDAAALWEAIESAYPSNSQDLLNATKVAGSTAFGALTTIAVVETGVGAAVMRL